MPNADQTNALYATLAVEVLTCSVRCLGVYDSLSAVVETLEPGSPQALVLEKAMDVLAAANTRMVNSIDNDTLAALQ